MLGIGNHWALSERVHPFELYRREVVRPPLVVFDLVGNRELLEEPQNPLRAGVVQVVLHEPCYLPE